MYPGDSKEPWSIANAGKGKLAVRGYITNSQTGMRSICSYWSARAWSSNAGSGLLQRRRSLRMRYQLIVPRRFEKPVSSSCGPPGVSSGNYDITADGQRFLMIKDEDFEMSSNRIVVVLNWVRELGGGRQ